ncbi:MAG: nucleotidyl transferase AbiEii/AbiGii toxin family protein [Chlamydiales bacterium]|nr:nucleotidyl transferase AbiEii/AbiGii toxin family protein [Chlamydiales bacterium]
MKISDKELVREASQTGFRPEMLQKVWHLITILNGISAHPFLKDKIALKGGTALNLFYFDLPRLSVDIDLNYIGKISKEEMLQERPLVEKALEAIFLREGMNIRRIPTKHAGGKWQLKYESALGGYGNLEVDINFMFRIPLCDLVKMRSHTVGERQTEEIPLLDIHELGAGKLAALFDRHASRDLFDAHELLTKQQLDIEKFRTICLLYGAISSTDWRIITPENINFDKSELQQQLLPVLRKSTAKNGTDWSSWTNQLLTDSKQALKTLFPLREHEIHFLNQLWDNGIIDPNCLTQDKELIAKIQIYPPLLWKSKLKSL